MLRLMFRSSAECFASVRCPKLEKCHLPQCMFDHTKRTRSFSTEPPESLKKHKLSPASSGPLARSATEPSPLPNSSDDLKVWAPQTLPGVGAPATVQQRMRFIAALIEAYDRNKVHLPRKTAVEQEFLVANSSSKHTYSTKMKQFIQKARMNAIHYFGAERDKTKKLSISETYDAVLKLVHTVAKLQRNGYVTEIPNVDGFELENTRSCNRCGEEFHLNDIMKESNCRFHERKKRFEKTDKYWECCDQVVGQSQGCKSSPYHVFKAKTAQELHKLIPFKEVTPSFTSERKNQIVGLDCEMGYTSMGMELIRLTVMDFYTGAVLCDEIVKPSGTVLDLNTNWSGVSSIPDDAKTFDEMLTSVIGDIINKDTIIVGHGLENDLNTLRLVHHQVVDTAVLFPKSLMKKYSLKELAFQFLNRKIQTGQHSSEEDSLAAIDIIKVHISRTDVKN